MYNLGNHTISTPCGGKGKCQRALPIFSPVRPHFSSQVSLSAHSLPCLKPSQSYPPQQQCHNRGFLSLPRFQISLCILAPQKMSMTHNFLVPRENISQKLTGIAKSIVLVSTASPLHLHRCIIVLCSQVLKWNFRIRWVVTEAKCFSMIGAKTIWSIQTAVTAIFLQFLLFFTPICDWWRVLVPSWQPNK